jgi:hypothetical protein
VKKIHNQAVALEVYAYKAKDAVPIREVVWIRSERCEQRFAVQLMEESSKHILAVGRSPAGADRGQTRKRPDNDGDWQSDRRPERPTRQPKVLKAPIEPTGHPTITITAGAAMIYSITSSARASNMGGMVRPSARAVGRLITKSNLVDCTTGRSIGFSPFRMRAV